MRRSTMGLVLLLAACAAPAPTSPDAATAEVAGEPVVAAAVEGRFQLTFSLPRTTWRQDEAIVGETRLGLVAGADGLLGGSGSGLLGFEFTEIGGDRVMGSAKTSDCRPYRISVAAPAISPITKSGGWSEDDPNADFYRSFFADPLVHLPPGEWDIKAVADFVEGESCDGAQHTMKATIRVRVTP